MRIMSADIAALCAFFLKATKNFEILAVSGGSLLARNEDRIRFLADYTPEQCQQDLTMLAEWKNLNTIQDTKKVSSIEEFKEQEIPVSDVGIQRRD